MIARFVMWWLQRQLNKLREDNPNYTIFEIRGVGKDYPKYLQFTDIESVREETEQI